MSSQRETPILAQLCALLIEDQFGELASRVFSVLARFGRQTLGGLVRASYLNSRQIKHGLVVLIQEHLIFHSAPSSVADPRTTYYSIDWKQSYALVRYGKVVKAVEDRFGKKAANLMSNLVTLGHTRIEDLRQAYFPPRDDESDNESDDGNAHKKVKVNGTKVNGHHAQTNGSSHDTALESADVKPTLDSLTDPNLQHGGSGSAFVNGDKSHPQTSNFNGGQDILDTSAPLDEQQQADSAISSVEELDTLIYHLMVHGWIMKVDDLQYLSPGDLHDLVRQEVLEAEFGGNNPTGTKDQSRLTVSILQRKRAIRDGWLAVPKVDSRKNTGAHSGLASSKRLKMFGGVEWMAPHGDTVELDGDLVIRFNPDKVAVGIRTDQLVRLVDKRMGSVTAKIYQTMLYTLEFRLKHCYEEWPDPPVNNTEIGIEEVDPRFLVTARDVAKKIDPNLDIFDDLDPHHVAHVTGSTLDHNGHMITPIDPADLSLDLRTKIVDTHIKILSDDPFHFVTWHSRQGYSQWRIEFEDIAPTMIQQEIENTVSARTRDGLGLMLIRALKKKGKLDERQTCNAMMMSAAEIRTIVNDMTVQGFVQTQEIPKVDRREAKHSVHLIWYDRQRAREKLLHDTYKGMVRMLQRLAFEKEKVQELLRKAERSDVVGNEEKWLSVEELDALKKWKQVEEKLLVQLFRIDDLVATLNDFTGPLLSV